MILIVTTKHISHCTLEIIEFLKLRSVSYEIISIEKTILSEKFHLHSKNQELRSSSDLERIIERTSVVWFLGWLSGNSFESDLINNMSLSNNNASIFKNCLLEEYNTINKFFFNKLRSAKWLPGRKMNISKLDQISFAIENKILVPRTIVCSSKTQLHNFFVSNKGIITKPMHHVYMIEDNGKVYFNRTRLISFENIPDNFAPTFFQEKIMKSFEIRALYLDGEIIASSIHTHSSEEVIDYRNYGEHTLRIEPYKLSSKVALKIESLMSDLGLCCGSLDFIVSENGDTYFLEVNPHGQLGLVTRAYPKGHVYSMYAKFIQDYERIK